MQPQNAYALIWFEGDTPYLLADHKGKTVLFSEQDALSHATSALKTQDDVDNAEDDLRYAIATELLEELYGWEAPTA